MITSPQCALSLAERTVATLPLPGLCAPGICLPG